MKTRKAVIYMEVACGCCGVIVNGEYHNSKSIKRLKNDAKDWRWIKYYGNVCPDCLAKLEKEKTSILGERFYVF